MLSHPEITNDRMTMTKKWFSIALFQLLPALLTAHTIKGVVVDQTTRRPLAFVNVTLLETADSSVVTGLVTDKKGEFEIANVPDGMYVLRLSHVGYKQRRIPDLRTDSRRTFLDLGTIPLTETTVNLDDVLVTGQKALFNMSIDRKVYNVDQDVISKSGSASELLQNIPSVEVDLDGNVSLRGSSNVLIMINGKTSPLMGRSRATVLQQMPASSIEKIEVITNPSAKYNPDGASGIINVVLRKNTSLGMNGSVSANAGNRDRYNANVRLNDNPGDFNLYGSYSVRKDNRNRTNSDARRVIDSTAVLRLYDQELYSNAIPLSHMVTLGGDYRFDESNSAGIAGNYFHNGFLRTDHSVTVLRDSNGAATDIFGRDRHDDEFEQEYGLTVNFEHKFPEEDHKLRFEYKVAGQSEGEDNRYTNTFQSPWAPDEYENTRIKPFEAKHELSVDYSEPLPGRSMLETGYAGQFNTYDLDHRGEYFDAVSGVFVSDATKTNRFILDENIQALYATFERSFGSFGVLGGLRAERVTTRSHLVTRDSVISNNYFSFYPTLHLSYRFNEGAELQLSYSRRTRRPEADELNPFPEYQDPRNIQSGNPRLLPEYIHSVELGCKLENDWLSAVPSVYVRSTDNRFTSVTQALNDSTFLTTQQNLSKDRSAGVELIVTASANELLTSHLSGNVYYNEIDASNLGYGSKRSTVTWTGALTVNVTPAPTTMVQVNANYNASRLTPQGERRPSYVVNIGVRQELLEKTLTLVVTLADIFRTVKRETDLDTPSLHQTAINRRDSQILYCGLTYSFGSPPKRSKEEQLKYDNGL